MMRVLLTDELALNYCMTGHKGEKLGKKTVIKYKLLCEAIQAATRSIHPNATDEEVLKFASEWLSKAKERLTSKAKQNADEFCDDQQDEHLVLESDPPLDTQEDENSEADPSLDEFFQNSQNFNDEDETYFDGAYNM